MARHATMTLQRTRTMDRASPLNLGTTATAIASKMPTGMVVTPVTPLHEGDDDDDGTFGVGAAVEARFGRGTVWYEGTIVGASANGYDVAYDDGDEERIDLSKQRLMWEGQADADTKAALSALAESKKKRRKEPVEPVVKTKKTKIFKTNQKLAVTPPVRASPTRTRVPTTARTRRSFTWLSTATWRCRSPSPTRSAPLRPRSSAGSARTGSVRRCSQVKFEITSNFKLG